MYNEIDCPKGKCRNKIGENRVLREAKKKKTHFKDTTLHTQLVSILRLNEYLKLEN